MSTGHGPVGDADLPVLFVAAWPPPEVVQALAGLPRPDEPGVVWEPTERLHVTLAYLGRCDPGVAADALGRLRAPVAQAVFGPAVSRLGRSVVCVPVAGLDDLAAAVVACTAGVGEPPDPRPFAGHVTLARLRHRAACGVAGHRISGLFEVSEIALVRSQPPAAGDPVRRYHTVATVALAH
jgi:2'-5' RNA ligase